MQHALSFRAEAAVATHLQRRRRRRRQTSWRPAPALEGKRLTYLRVIVSLVGFPHGGESLCTVLHVVLSHRWLEASWRICPGHCMSDSPQASLYQRKASGADRVRASCIASTLLRGACVQRRMPTASSGQRMHTWPENGIPSPEPPMTSPYHPHPCWTRLDAQPVLPVPLASYFSNALLKQA